MIKQTCAIVVTFNRRELLLGCLERLKQELPNHHSIVVVDNGSSDDSAEQVRTLHPDVTVTRLERNVGGAGGFAAGLSIALSQDFDTFWLMDDDGAPIEGCLRELVAAMETEDLDVAAPVVVSSSETGQLSFGLNVGRSFVYTYAELIAKSKGKRAIFSDANFFNGVLVTREAVLRIGLPKPELFIRGDEVEYLFRVRRAGLRCATISAARFVHPSGLAGKRSLVRGRFIVAYTGDKLKDYCTYRNRAYIFVRYGKYHTLAMDVVRYALYFAISRFGDMAGLLFWAGATRDGILGRFGTEQKFLRTTK